LTVFVCSNARKAEGFCTVQRAHSTDPAVVSCLQGSFEFSRKKSIRVMPRPFDCILSARSLWISPVWKVTWK